MKLKELNACKIPVTLLNILIHGKRLHLSFGSRNLMKSLSIIFLIKTLISKLSDALLQSRWKLSFLIHLDQFSNKL